jgi:HTH-type transcriptional regulator, sugar sensing transcriptional regulator
MSSEQSNGAGWLTSCAQGLQALGFTEHEARAYVALLQCQPATAYEVSKLSGLPRANAYNVFESLTKKQAVQPVSENPVRYAAVDPQQLLGRIAEDTSTRCHQLAEKLVTVPKADGREYVWVVEGDDIHAKISNMIERACRHVWIKGPEQMLERHMDTLAAAAERGVAIVIVLFGGLEAKERLKLGPTVEVHLHEGNGILVGLAEHLFTMSIDFEEALVVHTAEGGYGTYTRTWPIVNMADTLIRHEVYVSSIFERLGPQIEKEFGPALLELRRKHLPPELVLDLEERLGVSRPPEDPAGGAPPAERPDDQPPTPTQALAAQEGAS